MTKAAVVIVHLMHVLGCLQTRYLRTLPLKNSAELSKKQLSFCFYLSKLKNFRMHLRVCLRGDASRLRTRPMLLYPATAVDAAHSSSTQLRHLVCFQSSLWFSAASRPVLLSWSSLFQSSNSTSCLRASWFPTFSFFPNSDASHPCPPWQPVLKPAPDDR